MASKRYALPDRTRCVSCGACAAVCPKGAIQVWRGCYAVVDEALCVGCGVCQRTCPADCIAMTPRDGGETA